MTTAFARAAHGHLVAALGTQPMGALLAVWAGVGFWAGIHVALTGHRLFEYARGLTRAPVIAGIVVLFLGAWVYKMIAWDG